MNLDNQSSMPIRHAVSAHVSSTALTSQRPVGWIGAKQPSKKHGSW